MTVASDPPARSYDKRPNRLFKNLSAKLASIPMILTALCVFVGGTVWTIVHSFTSSRLLPKLNWVGFLHIGRFVGPQDSFRKRVPDHFPLPIRAVLCCDRSCVAVDLEPGLWPAICCAWLGLGNLRI